jgi:hypothetical protein
MKLGEKWHTDPRFYEAFHRFHLVVEIALLAGIVWFVWSHVNPRKTGEAAKSLSGRDEAIFKAYTISVA